MPAVPKLRADAQRNRERVFAAAKAAFAEDGAEAGMEDIAARAGVGVGTLYRAFGSRSGLVEAIYADEVEALEASAERLAGGPEPWPALTAWLRDYVAALASKRAMMSELTPIFQQRPAVLEGSRRRAADALDRLLRPTQAAGVVRPDLQAADLLRLVNGVITAGAPDPGRLRLLLAVVLDGIKARGAAA